VNQHGSTERAVLKARAKELMKTVRPAAWLMVLVYMAATNLVSGIVESGIAANTNIELLSYYASQGDTYMVGSLIRELFASPGGYLAIFLSIAVTLYTTVVDYGYVSYSMRVVRNKQAGYGELFSRFYMAGKIILSLVLEVVFVSLWSMLFIIPGIIAAYRYRMVIYLLLDDPDCPVLEAFQRSKLLMMGRKMELFQLDFSFFGWLLLAALLIDLPVTLLGMTPGANLLSNVIMVAFNLFLVPYQQFTFTGWYEAIRPREVGQTSDYEIENSSF